MDLLFFTHFLVSPLVSLPGLAKMDHFGLVGNRSKRRDPVK